MKTYSAIGFLVAACRVYQASASSNVVKWIPETGQPVDVVLRALDITMDELKALNPYSDLSVAEEGRTYNVPYKEQPLFGSWDIDCTHLLRIPSYPSIAIPHTPTVRGSVPTASDKHFGKPRVSTCKYSIPGTGAIVQPTTTRNEGQEGGSIGPSNNSPTSITPSFPSPSDIYSSYDRPTSCDKKIHATIETFVTSTRSVSEATTLDGKTEDSATTLDQGTSTSMDVRSQSPTDSPTRTKNSGLGSVFEDVKSQLEKDETFFGTVTSTDLTTETMTRSTEASTTVFATEQSKGTSTTDAEGTKDKVYITSTVDIVKKVSLTSPSPGQTALPSPTCEDEKDFQGHANIHEERVRRTAFEWCASPDVAGLMSGDDECVVGVQSDQWDVLYEYSICWASHCVGEPQDRWKPLGDKGPRCKDIFHHSWKACNNGGVGGLVQAGCLNYSIRAGVGKSQGYR
ncbi:uncharacterized protein FIESC28_05775 [Fusarium coffeatum]|uniref:LysM domain-containing protein n=1 Tax=Fusarium coffeatum TaxID=231269 RepID=A0A366RPC5_9HYPO|nr:uncharacterized protein FIESC28_05775 [Fusarium coffeatum]RBR18953.1 hypothetical protein FIESC28_05775 [Fusarium coffeatum]